MLRFITVFHARIKGERHVSSLAIGGKPHYQPAGYAKVVGNMSMAPASSPPQKPTGLKWFGGSNHLN